MKKSILAMTMLVASLSASAQADIFDNPNNEAYFGARIGLDISSTSNSNLDMYSNGAGFTAGAVYNIPVYKNLYVEPGLTIFYNTFGTEVLYGTEGLPDIIVDGSIRNWGFRIPLVAGYFFDFTDDVRVAPFTGPQLNLNFYAHEKLLGQNESIFGEGGFKHVDLQWAFGVGVTYRNYYLSVSGGIGMTRAMDLKMNHFCRNTFNITLGYNF